MYVNVHIHTRVHVCMCMCACACVCVRGKERDREIETETHRETNGERQRAEQTEQIECVFCRSICQGLEIFIVQWEITSFHYNTLRD